MLGVGFGALHATSQRKTEELERTKEVAVLVFKTSKDSFELFSFFSQYMKYIPDLWIKFTGSLSHFPSY